MADNKTKKMTMTQQQYQALAKLKEPPRPILLNCFRAFLAGGFICLIGEALTLLFEKFLGFTETTSGNPTVAVLILISVILTSLGLYDRFSQWAGAGSAVPVTGFANSLCSAALEHRSEGIVLGIGGNMFKIAGAVIVFGTVAAFFIGIIHILIIGGGK